MVEPHNIPNRETLDKLREDYKTKRKHLEQTYEAYQNRRPQDAHILQRNWNDATRAFRDVKEELEDYQADFNMFPPHGPPIYDPMEPDHDLDDLYIHAQRARQNHEELQADLQSLKNELYALQRTADTRRARLRNLDPEEDEYIISKNRERKDYKKMDKMLAQLKEIQANIDHHKEIRDVYERRLRDYQARITQYPSTETGFRLHFDPLQRARFPILMPTPLRQRIHLKHTPPAKIKRSDSQPQLDIREEEEKGFP
jgi:inorganic pyrophosphatase